MSNLELTFECIRKARYLETKIDDCPNCEQKEVFYYTGQDYKCMECGYTKEKK